MPRPNKRIFSSQELFSGARHRPEKHIVYDRTFTSSAADAKNWATRRILKRLFSSGTVGKRRIGGNEIDDNGELMKESRREKKMFEGHNSCGVKVWLDANGREVKSEFINCNQRSAKADKRGASGPHANTFWSVGDLEEEENAEKRAIDGLNGCDVIVAYDANGKVVKAEIIKCNKLLANRKGKRRTSAANNWWPTGDPEDGKAPGKRGSSGLNANTFWSVGDPEDEENPEKRAVSGMPWPPV
jgi:hypothetical protein